MAKIWYSMSGIFLVTLVTAILYIAGIFAGLNLFLTDILYTPKPMTAPVVVVAIDDASIQAIGQWPWKREVYAQLLGQLQKYQPQVVGFDVLFSEPSRVGTADDSRFAQAISVFPHPVVLAEQIVYDQQGRVALINRPLVALGGNRAVVNLLLDRDNVVRTLPKGFSIDGQIRTPFSYALVQLAGATTTQPRAAADKTLDRIFYRGGLQTVQTISLIDVLNGRANSLFPEHAYVLVGATASNLHDEHATPFAKGTPMSGVEIHAQIVDSLVTGDVLREISTGWVLGLLALFAALTAWAVLFIQRIIWVVPAVIVIFFLQLILSILLFVAGWVVPMVYTSLSVGMAAVLFGLLRYVFVDREKRYLRSSFAKYVSETVLTDILKHQKEISLGGQEYQTTILFSDIRGFTTFSEQMTPHVLIQFLNMYLSRMTTIILNNAGVIDKYIGDAIMAFWGAPITSTTHAYDAIRSAVAMIESLVSFNHDVEAQGHKAIGIGVGLNTGSVIAGNIGSDTRFDYTVIGDSVNLASRLESQTKQYGVGILVSEHTIAALSDEQKKALASRDIVWREIDRLVVKGKVKPVAIFEVLNPTKVHAMPGIVQSFARIYQAYSNAQWATCIDLAHEHLIKWQDKPAEIIRERAEYYREHPTEWQGHYVAKEK